MTDEQKEELKQRLRALEILAWDHCHKCGRSQSRFTIYWEEQLNLNTAEKLGITCVWCDGPLETYHEDENGPFSRPKGWKVPTYLEFQEILKQLTKEFGYELKIENFKSRAADQMSRPTADDVDLRDTK